MNTNLYTFVRSDRLMQDLWAKPVDMQYYTPHSIDGDQNSYKYKFSK